MTEERRGFLSGVAAYGLWGLFPLYWPLLEPAAAVEILAHRVVWSVGVVLGLLALRRRVGNLRAIVTDRRTRAILAFAAAVLAVNWWTYIWGVNHGHVVETSLGYFITPLISVLLGVVVLHERLRGIQWLAVGIATLAVVVLTVDYARPPWLALVLAVSFGSYGLAKKKADVGAIEGLSIETLVLLPLAGAYLLLLQVQGQGHFGDHGWAYALLLVGTGAVTAVPLLFFGAAATRVSLTTLGMLQYLAPLMQFALGLLVFHEEMSTARWVGFALVWLALMLLTGESLHNRHRSRVRVLAGVSV
jgi:chloramphenicol-sensitive protein RarD